MRIYILWELTCQYLDRGRLQWPINYLSLSTNLTRTPCSYHSARYGMGNKLRRPWHFIFPSDSYCHMPTSRFILGLASPVFEPGIWGSCLWCWMLSVQCCSLCTLTPQEVKVEALICFGLWWKHGPQRALKGKLGERWNSHSSKSAETSGTGRRQPWDHKQYERHCLLSWLQSAQLSITGKCKR